MLLEPSAINVTTAQLYALHTLLTQILSWPNLTPICMDHYEHEALKSLYENLSEKLDNMEALR